MFPFVTLTRVVLVFCLRRVEMCSKTSIRLSARAVAGKGSLLQILLDRDEDYAVTIAHSCPSDWTARRLRCVFGYQRTEDLERGARPGDAGRSN